MDSLPNKKITFLTLAIIGLILPLYFVSQFFGEIGSLNWSSFINATVANYAVSSIIVDLFVVLVAFIVWMIPEGKKLGMKNWWIYLFFSTMVSAAFGIPFFLFMREKYLESN